ncbi:MAG TPA: hypothetical protein VNA13_01210 [Xanthomonadales bacterium]|nr:hypothetical protein [Xanthomonadales bacterium]
MKNITHKKTSSDDILFDMNVKVAIAFGLAAICFLLLYIALFK